MTDIIEAIAEAAAGARSAAALLDLEPGEAALRVERRDETWSMVSLYVGEHWGAQSTFSFR
jgi:hypothetical protein